MQARFNAWWITFLIKIYLKLQVYVSFSWSKYVKTNQIFFRQKQGRSCVEGLDCDKNRKQLQVCRHRWPQCWCCSVVTFIWAGARWKKSKERHQRLFPWQPWQELSWAPRAVSTGVGLTGALSRTPAGSATSLSDCSTGRGEVPHLWTW